MKVGLLLVAAVMVLAFANGTNDNFKGVATLWGASRTGYGRALTWATVFTFFGALSAALLASTLAAKFNGSNLVSASIYTKLPFLGAVILGASATVLLASRLGLPISTTHALTGGLIGAGIAAAGVSNLHLSALGKGVLAPLLFSPLAALMLTLVASPMLIRSASRRDCVCITSAETLAAISDGMSATAAVAPLTPQLIWSSAAECDTAAPAVRWQTNDILHWTSGAAISFARGLNDTPKIAAVLLVGNAIGARLPIVLVASAMALGGALGAGRVARTMSRQITPMGEAEAVGANLVSAALVLVASRFGLPVSTTHVTAGSLFGIGLRRRGEANWRRVRDILFSWAATLPMGAALAAGFYYLLAR